MKVRVTENFNLKAFDELKNIVRADKKNKEHGKLYTGDTFECTQELCEYLGGKNEYYIAWRSRFRERSRF